MHLATVGHPILCDTGEERLLVLLDPPHISKVFWQLEAHGVSEEVAEPGGEPGGNAVGDEGGQVTHVHIGESLQEVAAHLTQRVEV